jgi:hypothetical protein
MTAAPRELTMEQRREILAREVALAVQHGARVEAQSDAQAVVVFGRPVNHLLHAVLTLFTVGLWALAWALDARGGGEVRLVITVQPDGSVEQVEGPRT